MEELTDKALPLVEEMTKVTQSFMDGFSMRKREKGVLDFNDLEHLALQILTEKRKMYGYQVKLQNIIEKIQRSNGR